MGDRTMINKETYKRLTEKDTCYYDEMDNIDIDEVYNRLVEIEDKIENGTLKELPYKVGSSVYAVNHSKYNISGGYVSEEFVNKIHISSHTILVETTENGIWISKSYLPQDFGDIVFTIKAEAEAKLKELQEKQQ